MDKRLPYNKKESFIYGSIIALVTVVIMLVLNVSTSFGTLNKTVIISILKLIPIIWVVVMLVESLLVSKIVNKLLKVLFNIFLCVTCMSLIMTIVGWMIGMGKISLEPFKLFFHHWPRNFCVAFWCEVLIAQPLARKVMVFIHNKK